jgi:predicted glycogen debranching enzyme
VTASSLAFEWDGRGDPGFLCDREWLVTNGLGGYASGTVLGTPVRRYHGLFVPNLAAPKGRHVLIGRFDEEIRNGAAQIRLGGAELADGTLETDAPAALREFALEDIVPVWRFAVGDALIERSIVMPRGHQAVCVHYRLLRGGAVRLHLRPYAVFRRVDMPLVTLPESPLRLTITHGCHDLDIPGSGLNVRLAVHPDAGVFVAHARTSAGALYRDERDRGYDYVETSFSPGYFAVDLDAAAPVTFVAATAESWPGAALDGAEVLAAEHARTDKLVAMAGTGDDPFARQLTLAADQFLVLPASRSEDAVAAHAAGTELHTVMAGYHWFGDWGRDTMVALDGLTLCTGRYREAAAILRTFAGYVRDGLLPNQFPEGERAALYNTIDATLWFFHAIDRYSRAVGDASIVAELRPVLIDIVEHHLRGTRFGIGVDPADGLLRGGADGVALTWMDAKFEDWVVTPRRGKPVEIQALWHNALALMSEWVGRREGGEPYAALAARARDAFNARFWNARRGILLDVVDGPEGDDPSMRPNQIFALSLAHPILHPARWASVLDAVAAQLLTPLGLRSLDPSEPGYSRDYHGDLRARDAAYHQGTVWPWLIGHFVDAWLRVNADARAARALLDAFPGHLHEAGIGSISEICDAEPPYRPRGCIAQAWSVAEVLRAWRATSPQTRTATPMS